MSLEDFSSVWGVYLLAGCYKWADLKKQEWGKKPHTYINIELSNVI